MCIRERSLGMTSISEEEKIVKLFRKMERNQDLVLYACTSGYPIPYSDSCIMEIKRLREKYGEVVKLSLIHILMKWARRK